jgi:hypothetical protein
MTIPEELEIMNSVRERKTPTLRESSEGGLALALNGKEVRHYTYFEDHKENNSNNSYHFSVWYDAEAQINKKVVQSGESCLDVLVVPEANLPEAVKYLMAVKDFYEWGDCVKLNDRIGSEFQSRINRVSGLKDAIDAECSECSVIHLDRRELGGLALAIDHPLGDGTVEPYTINHYFVNPEKPEITFSRKEEGHEKVINKYHATSEKLAELVEYLLAKIDHLEFSDDLRILDTIRDQYLPK